MFCKFADEEHRGSFTCFDSLTSPQLGAVLHDVLYVWKQKTPLLLSLSRRHQTCSKPKEWTAMWECSWIILTRHLTGFCRLQGKNEEKQKAAAPSQSAQFRRMCGGLRELTTTNQGRETSSPSQAGWGHLWAELRYWLPFQGSVWFWDCLQRVQLSLVL